MYLRQPAALVKAKTVFLERSVRGVLLRVVVWYLFLCGLLYSVQEDLLFFSVKVTPEQWQQRAAENGLEVLPESFALVAHPPGPSPSARSTVVYFHGNASLAFSRHWLSQEFTRRGHRIVFAEYPGYGPRNGEPGRDALVQDAKALLAQVRQRYPGPVQLWGESLGSGVASSLAAAEIAAGRKVDKLTLLVPFNHLAEVARRATWHLFPVTWLLRHDFDNGAALSRYPGPAALVVARQDEVVGVEQGRTLHQRLAPSATLLEIDTGHNRWPDGLRPEHWEQLLRLE